MPFRFEFSKPLLLILDVHNRCVLREKILSAPGIVEDRDSIVFNDFFSSFFNFPFSFVLLLTINCMETVRDTSIYVHKLKDKWRRKKPNDTLSVIEPSRCDAWIQWIITATALIMTHQNNTGFINSIGLHKLRKFELKIRFYSIYGFLFQEKMRIYSQNDSLEQFYFKIEIKAFINENGHLFWIDKSMKLIFNIWWFVCSGNLLLFQPTKHENWRIMCTERL